ncbi:MAG: transposase [Oscillospiraceae bacterium]|nr:transposase [Oscillospiraceae bacterium]
MKQELPVRKDNRIKKYDYSQNGAYFITVCTKNRKCLLSQIVGGGVLDAPQNHLTGYGRIVDAQIREMNQVYTNVQAEKYVVMPNHIHLLIGISDPEHRTGGTSRTPSPTNAVIPSYLSTLKRMCNKVFGENIWQRSYHDHVIRGERDYQMIWQYIDANPALWEKDCFYTEE